MSGGASPLFFQLELVIPPGLLYIHCLVTVILRYVGPVVLRAEESKGETFPIEPRMEQLMGSMAYLYVKGKMGLAGEEPRESGYIYCTAQLLTIPEENLEFMSIFFIKKMCLFFATRYSFS